MNREKWRASLGELKKVKSLTTSAMLIALAVILSFVTIAPSDYLRIGLSFIPKEVMAAMFGPVIGTIGNGITDIIQYTIKPTGPYFFGWTFNTMLVGLFGGIMLYRQPAKLWRVIAVNTFEALVNIFLATWYLTILYGNAFMALFPMRAVKNLIQLPINIFMFYALWKVLEREKLIDARD